MAHRNEVRPEVVPCWNTFITAFFCVVFVPVESTWAVRASTVGISLSVMVGFRLFLLVAIEN